MVQLNQLLVLFNQLGDTPSMKGGASPGLTGTEMVGPSFKEALLEAISPEHLKVDGLVGPKEIIEDLKALIDELLASLKGGGDKAFGTDLSLLKDALDTALLKDEGDEAIFTKSPLEHVRKGSLGQKKTTDENDNYGETSLIVPIFMVNQAEGDVISQGEVDDQGPPIAQFASYANHPSAPIVPVQGHPISIASKSNGNPLSEAFYTNAPKIETLFKRSGNGGGNVVVTAPNVERQEGVEDHLSTLLSRLLELLREGRSLKGDDTNAIGEDVAFIKEEDTNFKAGAQFVQFLKGSFEDTGGEGDSTKDETSSLPPIIQKLRRLLSAIDQGPKEAPSPLGGLKKESTQITRENGIEESFKGPIQAEVQPLKGIEIKREGELSIEVEEPLSLRPKGLIHETAVQGMVPHKKRQNPTLSPSKSPQDVETTQVGIKTSGETGQRVSKGLQNTSATPPIVDERVTLQSHLKRVDHRRGEATQIVSSPDSIESTVGKGHHTGSKSESIVHAHNGPDIEVVQRVADHVARAVRNGEHSVRLRLHPPELGRVRVELRVDPTDHVVRATFIADAKEVRGLLEQHHYLLRETLAQHGYHLQDFSVHQATPESDVGNGMGWASSWGHSGGGQGTNQEGRFLGSRWSMASNEAQNGDPAPLDGDPFENAGLSIRV